MKLEKLFEAKENKLFKLSGEEVPLSKEMVFPVKWSDVEGNPEEYNEEFLAKLREDLKSLESDGKFVFIEPEFDKDGGAEQFTAAMKHCARRIKDCRSVIGFAIPAQVKANAADYQEALLEKHGHYVFFAKEPLGASVVLY